MALPGLSLSSNVSVPVVPERPTAIHELQANSEWRFEVAFGENVEVKVDSLIYALNIN